jgi:hypothetical protein
VKVLPVYQPVAGNRAGAPPLNLQTCEGPKRRDTPIYLIADRVSSFFAFATVIAVSSITVGYLVRAKRVFGLGNMDLST